MDSTFKSCLSLPSCVDLASRVCCSAPLRCWPIQSAMAFRTNNCQWASAWNSPKTSKTNWMCVYIYICTHICIYIYLRVYIPHVGHVSTSSSCRHFEVSLSKSWRDALVLAGPLIHFSFKMVKKLTP
jgi:hypothetical protein